MTDSLNSIKIIIDRLLSSSSTDTVYPGERTEMTYGTEGKSRACGTFLAEMFKDKDARDVLRNVLSIKIAPPFRSIFELLMLRMPGPPSKLAVKLVAKSGANESTVSETLFM